jgi:hypothetical protein
MPSVRDGSKGPTRREAGQSSRRGVQHELGIYRPSSTIIVAYPGILFIKNLMQKLDFLEQKRWVIMYHSGQEAGKIRSFRQ